MILRLQFLISLALVSICALFWVNTASTSAEWSEPFLLNAENGATPYIISDSSGVIHVFWGSAGYGDQDAAIFYRKMVNGNWSEIIDIIAPPTGDVAIYPNVVIDTLGYFHLIWVSDQLYYSQAHISQALSPRGWTKPYALSDSKVVNGVIKLGLDESLNILYTIVGEDPSVNFVISKDLGHSWGPQVNVAYPENNGYPLTCSMVIDQNGQLHATWAESILVTPPAGIYYSTSNDDGGTWSYPIPIAIGGYAEPALGVDGVNKIHIIWTGTGEWAGKYHVISDVGNGWWSDIERLFPGGYGILGFSDMLTDATGRMFLAIPVGSQTNYSIPSRGQILVTSWVGQQWEASVDVTENMINSYYENGNVSLTLSSGNELHLVWVTQNLEIKRGSGFGFYIWHSMKKINAPSIRSTPIPDILTIDVSGDINNLKDEVSDSAETDDTVSFIGSDIVVDSPARSLNIGLVMTILILSFVGYIKLRKL